MNLLDLSQWQWVVPFVVLHHRCQQWVGVKTHTLQSKSATQTSRGKLSCTFSVSLNQTGWPNVTQEKLMKQAQKSSRHVDLCAAHNYSRNRRCFDPSWIFIRSFWVFQGATTHLHHRCQIFKTKICSNIPLVPKHIDWPNSHSLIQTIFFLHWKSKWMNYYTHFISYWPWRNSSTQVA